MTTIATATPAPPSTTYDNDREVVLIDLSSIAHPLFHMSASDPNPNATSIKTVGRVRALASGKAHVAVCCDSGRSFRKDLDPSYKAQRPESDATLQHQIALTIETLKGDGFPVWAVKGFEADDLIASGVARVLATPELTALIVSDDKDLLQLVGPRVLVKRLKTGDVYDAKAVFEKYRVTPEQMRDYLTLVGDASDNVAGCPSVGPVNAARILQTYASLDDMYAAFDKGTTQMPIGLRTKLQEFREQAPRTKALIDLRTDVAIPFEELGRERVPVDAGVFALLDAEEIVDDLRDVVQPLPPASVAPPSPAPPVVAQPPQAVEPEKPANGGGQAIARRAEVLPVHPDFGLQLEPRSVNEAIQLANHMHASRLFSQFGSPQAVLATVMAGREFGMQAMASLRAFHVIDGKPTLSAGAIQALVLKSGKAKYFRCTERTPQRATFETQRGDDPPIKLTFTIEEARAAFTGDDDKFKKSGYGRNPSDLLVARSSSKLARLVYPDVILGIYAEEEFDYGGR